MEFPALRYVSRTGVGPRVLAFKFAGHNTNHRRKHFNKCTNVFTLTTTTTSVPVFVGRLVNDEVSKMLAQRRRPLAPIATQQLINDAKRIVCMAEKTQGQGTINSMKIYDPRVPGPDGGESQAGWFELPINIIFRRKPAPEPQGKGRGPAGRPAGRLGPF